MVYYRAFSGFRPFLSTTDEMVKTAFRIAQGEIDEEIWLLEHQSVYTAGTSARPETELLDQNISVVTTGRGGKITWHGPGQRIVYLMLDLRKRKLGPRDYVHALQDWIVASLDQFDIAARGDAGNIGVWVGREKIAAIGVRISRGVSLHGVAINVDPELSRYDTIIPCGIPSEEGGITSIQKLLGGDDKTLMKRLDSSLLSGFNQFFGSKLVNKPVYKPDQRLTR